MDELKSVIERIVEEIATRSKCIIFITDVNYRGLIDVRSVKMPSFLKYDVSKILLMSDRSRDFSTKSLQEKTYCITS